MAVPQIFIDEIDRLTEVHGYRVLSIRENGRLKRAIARTIIAPLYDTVRMDTAPWINEGTDEEIIDTARHEYAHVMDWHVYGNHGHGPTWKALARSLDTKASATKVMERRTA